MMERYLEHLTIERRMSKHTESGYKRDLERLHSYCQQSGLLDWADINPHRARAFAGDLRRQGLSPRSIQRALSASRGFYRYLMKQRLVQVNPFSGTTAPKADKKLPKSLSVDQVSLLVAVEAREPIAIRDRAMMELFYSSGLRLSELVELNLQQIDLDQGSVRAGRPGRKFSDCCY